MNRPPARGNAETFATKRGLSATMLVGTMAFTSALPFALGALGPLLVREGVPVDHFGLLFLVYYCLAAFVSWVIGPHVDGWPLRVSFVGMIGLAAVGPLIVGVSGARQTGLLAAVAVASLAGAVNNPITNRYLEESGSASGLVVGLKQSGVQLSTLVVGVTLPATAAFMSWRTSMIALSVTTIGFAAAGATWSRRWALADRPSVRLPRTRRMHRVERTALVRLSCYAGLMGFGMGAINTYVGVYASERLGASTTVAGMGVGVLGAASLLSRLVWSWRASLVDSGRLWAYLTWAGVGCVAGLGLVITSQASGLAVLVAGLILIGVTGGAWNVGGVWLLLKGFEENLGSASAVMQGLFYLGLALGPALYGQAIAAGASYEFTWALCGVALCGATFCALSAWHWTTRNPSLGFSRD